MRRAVMTTVMLLVLFELRLQCPFKQGALSF